MQRIFTIPAFPEPWTATQLATEMFEKSLYCEQPANEENLTSKMVSQVRDELEARIRSNRKGCKA